MANPLQPALIIGLGGSGIEIVRRFRRRLLRDYPGATHVRFLGIDTDPQSQDRPDSPRLPDDEFHHAGNFAMAQYVGEASINNFPAIRAWWRSYTNLPFAFVAVGAGQRRPIGRLALFVHFDDVKAAITRQLQAIFQADSFNQLPPEYRRRVTVYVVASTCGGTGTGMFLDVAYAARQLVPEVMPQVMPKVRSLLLMPSAFIGTNRVPAGAHTALRANAFGALSELDWCMTKTVRRDPIGYPTRMGTWMVSRDPLAFDSCFLLGNQDAQGAVYTNWNDLVERGSAHLHVTLASSLTKAGESALDNVESWMGALPAVKGRTPMYSSMNVDEIQLPAARVHARWTKRFARELVDRLEQPAVRDGRGVVATAMRELEGTAGFGWLNRTIMQDDIRSMVPDLPQFAAAARQVDPDRPDPELLIRNADALQAEAQRLLERSRIAEQVTEALGATTDEVDAAVRRVLAEGSLEDALLLLRQVRERLDAMAERAREQRQRLPIDWQKDFADRVRGVKKGILQRKDAYARDLGVQAAQALGAAALSWERTLWTRVLDRLNDATSLPLVRTHLDRRRDQLDRLRALVHTANVRIQALPEPTIAAGMDSAISDEEMDAAYEQPERQERLAVFAREHVGALLDEEVPSAEGVVSALVAIAGRAVHLVAADFVAGAQIRAEHVAERVDRLRPLAVFTAEWEAFAQGGLAERPQRVALLGLPERMAEREERDKEILHMLQVPNRETTVVGIADDDRVLMLAQYHGFPLFALAELAECRRAYEADAGSRELRFTLPEQEARRWSVEPSGAQASARWFAVALALGRIRLDPVLGGYLYLDGPDGSAQRVLTKGDGDPGRSREQARDEFLRQGLGDQFQLNLSRELAAQDGNGRLYERLQEWIARETERAADPSYPSTFRADIEEVRRYAESIRWS